MASHAVNRNIQSCASLCVIKAPKWTPTRAPRISARPPSQSCTFRGETWTKYAAWRMHGIAAYFRAGGMVKPQANNSQAVTALLQDAYHYGSVFSIHISRQDDDQRCRRSRRLSSGNHQPIYYLLITKKVTANPLIDWRYIPFGVLSARMLTEGITSRMWI